MNHQGTRPEAINKLRSTKGTKGDKNSFGRWIIFSRGVCGFVLVFLLHWTVRAEESPLQFSGSVKTYVYGVGTTPLTQAPGGWIIDSPLRLRALYKPDDSFSLEVAEKISNQFQSGASSAAVFSLPPPSSYRFWDFSNPAAGPANGDGDRLIQNLDRLCANFHWGDVDLTVGRQVVSFGSGRVSNPTDLLAPFNIQTRDQEYRSGVDALRLRYAWGAFGGLDAGWVSGKDARWENSAAFVRPSFRIGKTDFSLISMVFQENLMGGADLQGSIGGAGVWAEGAWVKTRTPDADYLRLSVGTDYQFTGDFYGFLEYHFNGAGQDQAAQYLSLSNPAAYGAGAVYFLGRHYLALSPAWQVDPLLSVQGEALANLEDGSFLALLNGEYNLVENWYVNLGVLEPVGGGPKGFTPTSEFGLYPAYFYAAGRTYF